MDIAQISGLSSVNLASGVRVLGNDSIGLGNFADILASMGGGLLSSDSTIGIGTGDSGGLSLEDMQAMLGLNGQSWNTVSTSNSDAVSQMMSILTALTQGLSEDTLDADKAGELMDLVGKMQDELWKNSIQNSQLLVAEQLMSMMGTDSDQSSALTLLNSLNETTNTQPIMELMVQSKPEEILEMLTGIPKETFANLVGQANSTTTTAQDGILTSGDLAQSETVEPLATGSQSGDATASQARDPQSGQSDGQTLNALDTTAQTGNAVQVLKPETGQPTLDQPGAADTAQAAASTQGAEAAFQTVETAETTETESQTAQSTDGDETVFQSELKEAAETTQTKETSQPVRKEIDIERLQTQVNEGVHLRGTGFESKATLEAKAAESEALAQDIGTQVNTGILTGLNQGEEQFSIKLNPEGLGEVLVKITKNQVGEMTLNLVTKSDETQRLLATQLEMLKTNLAPLNVKVDEVMTEQQETFYNQQQAFEQQQRNWSWQSEGFSGVRAGAVADSAAAEVLAQTSPKSALDTYV